MFEKLSKAYRLDEATCVKALLTEIAFSEDQTRRIQMLASDLTIRIRQSRLKKLGFDAFLRTYGNLSSPSGVSLMCLAEALLRIPDNTTQSRLIKDKLNIPYWVAVMIRPFVVTVLQIVGKHFVIGKTIQSALKIAKPKEAQGYCYSYDMLGEAAKTKEDAAHYLASYQLAIAEIAKISRGSGPFKGPGISVKLSALHPRYEWVKRDQMMIELYPILKALVLQAKAANIGFTIDAEEADRLELSLVLIERLMLDPDLAVWQGFGFAVQLIKDAPVLWLIGLLH